MPYKVFVAGEEALAADVNSYLMSQTVPRFTNATQRTSQLTAPVLNQLSMLDSKPGAVQYWTGSAWADAIPFLQTGLKSGTTDANGDIGIVFPVAFANSPAVLTQMGSVSAGNYAVVALQVYASNPNGISVRCCYGTTPFANQGVNIYWWAMGLRA